MGWAEISHPNFTTSDAGNIRTITDLGATGAARLYRVRITKP
jgi:hypothetical protein